MIFRCNELLPTLKKKKEFQNNSDDNLIEHSMFFKFLVIF